MALALLAIIATAFLMAIFTSTKTIMLADERTNAESLARSQIEYVKQQEYNEDGNYNEIIPPDPDSYEISSFLIEQIVVGLQRITVAVGHPGAAEPILTLEGYKVDEGVY